MVHEDLGLGRLSIGGNEPFKFLPSENDDDGHDPNAKNNIIAGSSNIKPEDVKAEPLDLDKITIDDALNIKTEPIENNENSIALDEKNCETKLNSQRLTTFSTDLVTTRKHKRNEQGIVGQKI